MSNQIVLENQNAGAPQSDWMLQPGTASSTIEGFATSMSTNVGDTIDFKINTDAADYKIDIYRLGYYGGDGARWITTIEHQADAAVDQPAPLRDASNGLVDAGNWSVTDWWDIPADATSGVYIAKLIRQDGTAGENLIPFVVTNNASTSDIVFQTADSTWQAYNAWGNSSLYTGAQAVSYNRPMDTPAGPNDTTASGPWNFLFGEELPAIYWLEENGYDVTYQSSIDVSTNGSLLLNHKAYLSVGHDEYWTAEQRSAVTAARDAGVNLNFWSGNEVYWKTELVPGIEGDPNRTLVSYKTTRSGAENPSGVWTGLWRDPSGGGNAENSLTGQLYAVDWDKTTPLNPIIIPWEQSQLQIWRNSPAGYLEPGQFYTTDGSYLGYEWDVNATSSGLANNGRSPAGLVPMSTTSITTNVLQDYLANNAGTGTATHNITMYRAPSGALVFGAGTIMWSWGLSTMHAAGPPNSPGNNPTDPAIQQAMVNLFALQGIQPETLAESLTFAEASSDTFAPTTTITSDVLSSVTGGQLMTITGTSTDEGGGVVAAVEVSTDGGSTWYNAKLSAGAEQQATWSYVWTPGESGTTTVFARAVDDNAWLEHPSLGGNFEVTQFYSNFSVSQGWDSADTPRFLTDITGDGKADLLGFGYNGIYFARGQDSDGQYNGGANFSRTLEMALGDLGLTQGYWAPHIRGVDYVGNFTASPTDHFSTFWGVGNDGLHYTATTSTAVTPDGNGYSYLTPIHATYTNFGLEQGWTQNYTIQTVFLSGGDDYASVVGFGHAGVWVGREAFAPGSNASQDYLAQGSSSLGNSSGWDSTLDIRTLKEFRGGAIDLNWDEIPDFVGMGADGLVYALGDMSSGQYAFGALHAPDLGSAATGGANFGSAQGWNNTTSWRFIADINNDGHEDIVGIGTSGVYVSMGQAPNADGSGAFGQSYRASEHFGTNEGWSTELHDMALGDMFGDGTLDIVAFGADNTFIAGQYIDPTTGRPMFEIVDVLHAYGSNQGFSPAHNFRGVADVSGTGTDSIVVSALNNTQVVSRA